MAMLKAGDIDGSIKDTIPNRTEGIILKRTGNIVLISTEYGDLSFFTKSVQKPNTKENP